MPESVKYPGFNVDEDNEYFKALKLNQYCSTETDIHFNLAVEEYLFEYCDIRVPVLFTW